MTREQKLRELRAEIDATYVLRTEADAHMRELLPGGVPIIQFHNEAQLRHSDDSGAE